MMAIAPSQPWQAVTFAFTRARGRIGRPSFRASRAAVSELNVREKSALLDGEIVALDAGGRGSNFARLQGQGFKAGDDAADLLRV